MLRNGIDINVLGVDNLFLNEVLSLNAQELRRRKISSRAMSAILNEVLSLNAQELLLTLAKWCGMWSPQ